MHLCPETMLLTHNYHQQLNLILIHCICGNYAKLTAFCYFYARDYDGKVTPEEVASAAMYLKDTLGKEGIQELISNLSKDKGQ